MCSGHGGARLGVGDTTNDNMGDEPGEMGNNLTAVSIPFTVEPTFNPTTYPSTDPSIIPTVDPTADPTADPSTDSIQHNTSTTTVDTLSPTTAPILSSYNVSVEITPGWNESGVTLQIDSTIVNETNVGFEFGGHSAIRLTDWCVFYILSTSKWYIKYSL